MQKSPVSKPLGTSFLHCDPTGRKKVHVMLLFQNETRVSAAAETAAIVVVVTLSEAGGGGGSRSHALSASFQEAGSPGPQRSGSRQSSRSLVLSLAGQALESFGAAWITCYLRVEGAWLWSLCSDVRRVELEFGKPGSSAFVQGLGKCVAASGSKAL